MLQQPLKEGRVVRFSVRLQRLLPGWKVSVHLFTVAQQHAQHISHPPLLLLELLNDSWKLKGQRDQLLQTSGIIGLETYFMFSSSSCGDKNIFFNRNVKKYKEIY